MVYEETLEEVGHEIKADRSHAQILLRITDSSKFEAEAERIISEVKKNFDGEGRDETDELG